MRPNCHQLKLRATRGLPIYEKVLGVRNGKPVFGDTQPAV